MNDITNEQNPINVSTQEKVIGQNQESMGMPTFEAPKNNLNQAPQPDKQNAGIMGAFNKVADAFRFPAEPKVNESKPLNPVSQSTESEFLHQRNPGAHPEPEQIKAQPTTQTPEAIDPHSFVTDWHHPQEIKTETPLTNNDGITQNPIMENSQSVDEVPQNPITPPNITEQSNKVANPFQSQTVEQVQSLNPNTEELALKTENLSSPSYTETQVNQTPQIQTQATNEPFANPLTNNQPEMSQQSIPTQPLNTENPNLVQPTQQPNLEPNPQVPNFELQNNTRVNAVTEENQTPETQPDPTITYK